MENFELGVYGEAKGEYTRQLCVFLVSVLESYFLELLEEAKTVSTATPQKALLQFQNLLQSIPDWNQDKVLRETARIQQECKCDYLEELLTAVFIAHTKVLSAIRLTSKQKKLQITIPKLDHFLHRVLSESARSLWTNAFLFVETSSIEKQKNLRQVEQLLHEAVIQAIRGLLPVKSILREYLVEDDEDSSVVSGSCEGVKEETVEVIPSLDSIVSEPVAPAVAVAAAEPVAQPEAAPVVQVVAEPVSQPEAAPVSQPEAAPVVQPEAAAVAQPEAAPVAQPEAEPVTQTEGTPVVETIEPPVLVVDTKPNVTFNTTVSMFSEENGMEEGAISDNESIDFLTFDSESAPLDGFEELDSKSAVKPPSPLSFETLPPV